MLVVMDKDGRFWTGLGWSDEYPNADLFIDFDSFLLDGSLRDFGVEEVAVVGDYGLDSERTLWQGDPSKLCR